MTHRRRRRPSIPNSEFRIPNSKKNRPQPVLFLKVLLDFIQINTADRANLVAFAAADAFVVVHLRAKVFYRDRPVFAGLHALHAADAAGLALFARLRALVVVDAKHRRLDGVERKQVDQMARTGVDAQLARAAFVGVDARHTVADEDRFIRAHAHAVAETDAAVDACFGAAESWVAILHERTPL